MKRVLTAVVLIPIVLLLILRAPIPLLAVVVAGVALLTIREIIELSRHYGIEPQRGPSYAVALLVFVLVIAGSASTAYMQMVTVVLGTGVLCAFAPFVFAAAAMRRSELRSAFPAAAVAVFSLTCVALPLAFLVMLRDMWVAAVPGAIWILYLLGVVWSGDIFALYVGKSIGRHKMAPRVSPNKTWEGAAASFIGSILVGSLIYAKAYAISTWLGRFGFIDARQVYSNAVQHGAMGQIIVLSALINVAAQLGDLVESLIKRGAGVKDSGSLLPGHGGMFDRIDALLFAAPVLWAYAVLRML